MFVTVAVCDWRRGIEPRQRMFTVRSAYAHGLCGYCGMYIFRAMAAICPHARPWICLRAYGGMSQYVRKNALILVYCEALVSRGCGVKTLTGFGHHQSKEN